MEKGTSGRSAVGTADGPPGRDTPRCSCSPFSPDLSTAAPGTRRLSCCNPELLSTLTTFPLPRGTPVPAPAVKVVPKQKLQVLVPASCGRIAVCHRSTHSP